MKTLVLRNAACGGSLLIVTVLVLTLTSISALAQNGRTAISFVSVCSDGTVPGTSGTCPGQTTDTHQIVVGPDGATSINELSTPAGDLKYLADEHSTIFPPNFLPNRGDYLFFVAGGGGLNVLSGAGPNANGQWQLHFAPNIGYYSNPGGVGPIFGSAMLKQYCPTVTDASLQDPTWDLSYGAVGTVVKDPTNPNNIGPGNLIMIYEGTNRCIGLTGGSNLKPLKNSFYSTIAVATSNDVAFWPNYRYQLLENGNLLYPLPYKNPCFQIPCQTDPTLCTSQNPCVGPRAPTNGAFGDRVCILNDCLSAPPNEWYGRYPVFSPQESIEDAIKKGKVLKKVIGYQAPSAFLDDARGDAYPYLYLTAGGLMATRAQLNGGTAPLSFTNWYQGSFSEAGRGGLTTAISFLGPQGLPENCEAAGQHPTMASFSYLDQTQQYLLTFVCMSSLGDPLTQTGGAGAAWFYSTNPDMSHQDHWSAPQEIVGSWVPYLQTKKNPCDDYDGWYPSFMSLSAAPGHLLTTGYTFYMHGCTGGSTPGGRRFSTRAFTINLKATRTFQGIDTQHVYALGTDANLWLEQGPFGSASPARTQVDGGISTFQALQDGTHNVLVMDEEGNLFLDSPPFGTAPPARVQVDYSVRSFQALNSQTIFVLGSDGNLSIEYAPFGTLPPFRQIVDASVRDFHVLDANKVLVLGADGNLWLEQAPFGTVPPARVQVDGNVYAFQKVPGSDAIYVLGTDGNLWLEQPPFGTVPPARVQVDGHVRSFQAMSAGNVFVLGTDGSLWLESAPFGTVPPARQQLDSKTKAFEALDLLHVYVLDVTGNLWLESAPFGTPASRQQVDGNIE